MILTGDCRDLLPTLEAESVQCVVTSPPYFGLRDYGVDGQIGLEPTPDEYVAEMVRVFREVRRVLRADGVCWLNLGDSFWNHSPVRSSSAGAFETTFTGGKISEGARRRANGHSVLKMKDLIGIPWRVAFALQADGWYLRSDIIWSKPNPMPESVRDRPTKAHEYLFLLTKSERYFYDADAIAEKAATEPHAPGWTGRTAENSAQMGSYRPAADGGSHSQYAEPGRVWASNGKKNARSVWSIATKPFPEAHFAVFPPELARRCILAGTSAKGCCPECGTPWEREVVRETSGADKKRPMRGNPEGIMPNRQREGDPRTITTGWRPTCDHGRDPIPCTVLDPFSGAGTTGYVAQEHGRGFVGIELNPEYVRIAEKRTAQQTIWTEPAA